MQPGVPEFYPRELTDESWAVLQDIRTAVPGAVLIGGWATWVRAGGPMSHDIDLIVSHADLEAIGQLANEVSTSTHIAGRKWRAEFGATVHADLYVPYQSRLGEHLGLRVEALLPTVEKVNDYQVLSREGHLITKMAALLDRPYAAPGRKDRYEIRSLLAGGADPATAIGVLRSAASSPAALLPAHVQQMFQYLLEERLPKKERAWLQTAGQLWTSLATIQPGPGPSPSPDRTTRPL